MSAYSKPRVMGFCDAEQQLRHGLRAWLSGWCKSAAFSAMGQWTSLAGEADERLVSRLHARLARYVVIGYRRS